jgi:UDP-glucose 4-epimerase
MPADRPAILLTGGAGYIGSHTCVALAEAGYRPVVLDDFSNSSRLVIGRLEELTGGAVALEEGDVGNGVFVREVLTRHDIAATIHFAAFKSVAQSVAEPLLYYRNNIGGLIALLGALEETGRRTLVFSSSATVYGAAETMPIAEDTPLAAINPYGQTKVMAEDMLRSLKAADPRWRVAALRYFNPVGAHPSGRIGEDPRGVPANLVPYVSQVAIGRHPYLQVFGDDYPTPDGTGVRDYVHVMDLAEGHVTALDHLRRGGEGFAFNLGTGRGYSVLEVVKAFERASGREIPYRILPRRGGDSAVSFADAALARKELGWQARRNLDQMCADGWRWQSQNPEGFK